MAFLDDYNYRIISSKDNTARVLVKDKTKSSYEDIPETFTVSGSFAGTYTVISIDECFKDCQNLLDPPSLPNSITSMREAFFWCRSLRSAPTIPSGVTDMYYAFRECNALEECPTIPNTVTNMHFCFCGCNTLTKACDIPGSVKDASYCFYSCENLVEAGDIANGVENIAYMFTNAQSLKTPPNIANSVTNMTGCFQWCIALESAPVLPSNLKTLSSTFNKCESLKEAPIIPNGVTIMSGCFAECTSLESPPVIPSTVTNLSSAFRTCTSLTYAPEIPSGVTDLRYCFRSCSLIKKAPSIPESVFEMDLCFEGCTSLSGNVYVANEVGTYESYGREYWCARDMFKDTVHPIYIVPYGAADYDSWKEVADQYDNVYMLTEGNSRPVLEFSAKRVASEGDEEEDPEGDCVYIVANATAYADRLPEGFVNDVYRLDLSDNGDDVEADWEVVSKDYMEYKTTVVMRTWVDLSTARHLLAMTAVDKYGAKSASITQIVAKTSMLLDFLAGNVGTGLAIGKKATREGLDVAIPSNFDTRVNVAGKLSLPTYMYSVPPEISALPFLPAVVVCLDGTGWLYTSKARMKINHHTPTSQYAPGTWGYLKDTTTWGDLIGGK